MVAKPLQNLPPSSTGESSGPKNGDDDGKARTSLTVEVKKEEVEEGDAPSMKLGLGIGESAGTHVILKQGKPDSQRCLLTLAQLRELQEQTLIFKYISSGLTVPPILVLPIWKSVAASFASVNPISIYIQFPSFVGYGPKGFDYGNMMDPEPGRCRRTDGKKWRCGKNVVLGGKYCERYMHRGCHRSRKRVELSQTTTSHGITTPPNSTSKNANASVLAPGTPQLMTRPSNSASTSHITLRTAGSDDDFKIDGKTVSGQKYSGMSRTNTAINYTSHMNSITATSPAVMYGRGKSSYINVNSPYITMGLTMAVTLLVARILSAEPATTEGPVVVHLKCLASHQGVCFEFEVALAQPSTEFCINFNQGGAEEQMERSGGARRAVVTNERYCEMHLHRGAKGY